jgi:hypothetical protein
VLWLVFVCALAGCVVIAIARRTSAAAPAARPG